jgi:hypothetical protein
MDVNKLLSICKGIDRFNAQDLMQDTFLRLNNRYPINDDYYKIFYTTAKNIFLDAKRKKTPQITSIDLIDIQDTETYNPSIYKKALDNFLIKKNNTIFADVIELYLVCPNITKMAKQTNISRIDCGFCTSFWIGTIIAIITLSPYLFILNFIISFYYGKNSK